MPTLHLNQPRMRVEIRISNLETNPKLKIEVRGADGASFRVSCFRACFGFRNVKLSACGLGTDFGFIQCYGLPVYRSIALASARWQTAQKGTGSRENITQSSCGR